MKRLAESYMSFTRTERMGIAGLCLLLLLLITIRFTMHLWVKPTSATGKEQQMQIAWQNFKKNRERKAGADEDMMSNAGRDAIVNGEPEENEAIPPSATLFAFDPNTLDSAGFRKLGLRERTTSNLLHWRAKGKKFYQKEDLKPLYTLTAAEYERLAPYITIQLPRIDLNTADSVELISIKGIGPRIAHRLLERRRKVGNFTSYDQLLEVYNFPEHTFSMLKQQLVIK